MARAVFVFCLLFLLPACSAAVEGANPNVLTIKTRGGETHLFQVEIADTPETRAEGLMFRQEMARDAGMLFDMKEDRRTSMWMKNTYIPLDMAFITKDGAIESIAENVRPHSLDSVFSEGPVRAVLEVNAGVFAELGVAAGDRVIHPMFEGL